MRPGFSLLACCTLALAIGANTALFSVIQGVLRSSLPYPDPERLVMVFETWASRGVERGSVSPRNYMDWKGQSRSFEHLAPFTETTFNLTGHGDPERVVALQGTADLFETLGLSPRIGRPFRAEEDRPGSHRVVLLGERLWRRRFGSDPDLPGRSIELDGRSYTVLGILPEELELSEVPENTPELWVPIAFTDHQLSESQRGAHWIHVIGRLHRGVSLDQAQDEMAEISRRLAERYPRTKDTGRTSCPSRSTWSGVSVRRCCCRGERLAVLLIACANLANLLLVRGSERGKELAIREALGAGRGRLLRQLLTEYLVLALGGGILGVVTALWGVDVLLLLAPAGVPRLDEVALDGTVLLFALALTLASGALAGTVAGLQNIRLAPIEGLKQTARCGQGQFRTGGRMVAAEVALAAALLSAAGLLVKSLAVLQEEDAGFDTSGVLTFRLSLPPLRYPEGEATRHFYQELLTRIAALPGVESAGAAISLPLGRRNDNDLGGTFSIEGEERFGPEESRSRLRAVTTRYFRTMRIPVLEGRVFDARDHENGPGIALVNETLARRYWAGETPLGKRLDPHHVRLVEGEPRWRTVIGVVADVKHDGFDQPPDAEMYVPHAQSPWSEMSLVVRTGSEPALLAASVRESVQELDSDLPLYTLGTLDELRRASSSEARFRTVLLVSLAGLALLLSSVGVYGVLAHYVGLPAP